MALLDVTLSALPASRVNGVVGAARASPGVPARSRPDGAIATIDAPGVIRRTLAPLDLPVDEPALPS